MNKTAKIGVILANLGTPDSPNPKDISRYLWQFLTDPRVVDLPRYKWFPLLKAIILPLRSKRIAKNYRSIWTKQGSPLLTITQQQKEALAIFLQQQNLNMEIEIGMTYGNPSIPDAVQKLIDKKVDHIIVLPLYPQYSSTTTGAVFDSFAAALKQQRGIVPFDFIHSYQLNQDYITALIESCKVRLKSEEFLLFSFHGIPLRYENTGDYYRTHCQQTAAAVAQGLGLNEKQWGVTFQSRFGKEEWLQPYTDDFLAGAAQQGIKNIAVLCPGFAADCLETLEEIAEENRELFLASGGQSYHYIPALNAEPAHIEALGKLLLNMIGKMKCNNCNVPNINEVPIIEVQTSGQLSSRCH
ncbi:ferrochelatase [Aggregatibacter actinomycetemcomitans]|uniref:ferrochelatase n=1 Tax=Aggregatibacter actinomycetemcomitans TaxID=714 RepID=UPI00197B987C|nr:ferrochelatase [Aggregatibacter actinomycetemcomitans]MBN6063491.1 ferrochelatase [Aggregatibacter actinomycetemcomitans]MBN6081112.1 ferrochelatase [Aggregatibacter actinomycetemcomitans]MBN6083364.1 ferrochelatase [Aggregatibacter actinomycetemcomitans]